MSKRLSTNERLAEQANQELDGWLDRLDQARLSLRAFVGENGQPSRLRPMDQWYVVPRGFTVSVKPAPNTVLEGGSYTAGSSDSDRERRATDLYANSEPFFGGVAIKACLNDKFENEYGIVADLICMQSGFDRRPPVFSDNAPNANFQGSAVFIPKFVPELAELTVVAGLGPA